MGLSTMKRKRFKLNNRARNLLWLSITTLLSAACGVQTPDNSEPKAFVDSQGAWSNKSIPVCFTNPGDHNKSVQRWIRSIVELEYEQKANVGLNFIGWQKCGLFNKNSPSIRIFLLNDPRYKHGGSSQVGMNSHRYYLSSYEKKDGSLGPALGQPTMILRADYCKSFDTRCKTPILHEFGHALGLHHEQNRVDSKSCSNKIDEGKRYDLVNKRIGPYDPNSIMEYCGTYDRPAILTKTDIKGLQHLYPKDNSGRLTPGLYANPGMNPPGVIYLRRSPWDGGKTDVWCDIKSQSLYEHAMRQRSEPARTRFSLSYVKSKSKYWSIPCDYKTDFTKWR